MVNKLNNEDKVWAGAEATINLGNYENVKISSGESRTVVPGDNRDEIRLEIMRKVIADVIAEGERVRSKPDDLYGKKEVFPESRTRSRRF